MNIIETIVPISIDNLKKYFTDKNTSFIIDYNNSSLKGNKFLTYISNLDVPCDVILDDSLECQELIKANLPLPAYDFCLKASHMFNLLNARKVISVTERANYIGRVRALAKMVCEKWMEQIS